jgi:two-component system sensor histidine kinase DesK
VSQIWEDERPTLSVGLLAPNARSVVGRGGALIWLAFVVFPVINAIGRHESVLGHGLAIAGAVLFVTAYVALVLCWRRRRSQTLAAALFAVLLVIAVALTAFDHSGWGFLFIYCGACAAMMGTPPLGSYGVALCSVLAAGVSALGGASGGTAIGFAASTLGIGLLMLLLRDLRIRNQELVEARAELARLAVARERERFARDLHDLLGHSLSVIALKAELAGRLLPEEPVDASREIADVENVARTALGEVREAVSGYRQPTLDGELAGARLALSTAGIHVAVDRTDVALDPEVEAVLSWAVREGATNVIRHSGAEHCEVRIRASMTEASAEVIDDGVGSTGPNDGGSGLHGLAERARELRGRLESGPLDAGGFRLAVAVPLGTSSAVAP